MPWRRPHTARGHEARLRYYQPHVRELRKAAPVQPPPREQQQRQCTGDEEEGQYRALHQLPASCDQAKRRQHHEGQLFAHARRFAGGIFEQQPVDRDQHQRSPEVEGILVAHQRIEV